MHCNSLVRGHFVLTRLVIVGCALSFLPAHLTQADDNSKAFDEIHVV